VTASKATVLGAGVDLVGVLAIGLLGLLIQAVLGVVGTDAAVGVTGRLATLITSRIQSRSLVMRA
jgi:hypothetical protein